MYQSFTEKDVERVFNNCERFNSSAPANHVIVAHAKHLRDFFRGLFSEMVRRLRTYVRALFLISQAHIPRLDRIYMDVPILGQAGTSSIKACLLRRV
jgi:hypothetical protein